MLEAVPVVWKVKCPELGEADKDGGQEVHWYEEPVLYVILITAAPGKRTPVCFPERIETQDLSGGRYIGCRAMCQTQMLEAVPVVWKVECLGEAGKDAGHKVHYDIKNLYCTVCYPHCCSSGKEPPCVPGRESSRETLVVGGRSANSRAMCDTLMLETESVGWKVICPEMGEVVGKKCTGMENLNYMLSSSL